MQLRYLWIQNCFTTGMAKLHKISTKENMPDVMTKYVTAEILRYLGAKIGLVTTTVMALCADFADYWETEATDVTNNNNSKPTIEHCKQSIVYCPKVQNAPRPYARPQSLPYAETVQTEVYCPRVQGSGHCSHCNRCSSLFPTASMATSYGFTVLGDFTGSSIAKATAKATAKPDPCAKGLAAMGEGAGSCKTAKADTEIALHKWQLHIWQRLLAH